MKILKFELENWRCFHGPQKITFDHRPGKITVFHAANGGGKTALINGLRCLFYGKVSSSFKNPTRLINNQAYKDAPQGESVCAKLVCEFEEQGRRHKATRNVHARKSSSERHESIDELIIVRDGKPVPDPVALINNVIPEAIHEFFYCEGEAIKKIFVDAHTQQNDLLDKLPSQIKEWFKISRLARTKDEANKASNYLVNQIQKSDTRRAVSNATQNLKEAQDAVKKNQTDLANTKSQKVKIEATIKAMMFEQEKNKEAQELAKKRNELVAKIEDLEKEEQEILTKRNKLISQSGFAAFLAEPLKFLDTSVDELTAAGQLPAPIAKKFLRTLLKNKKCICERPLEKNTDAYSKIEELQNQIDYSDKALEIQKMQTWCQTIFKTKGDAVKNGVVQNQTDHLEVRKKNDQLASKLNEYEEDLKKIGNPKTKDLQGQIDSARSQRDDLIADAARLENQALSLDTHFQNCEREHRKAASSSQKNALNLQALEFMKLLQSTLEELYSSKSNELREGLAAMITEKWRSVSNKPYQALIDDGYQVRLVDNNGDTANISEGESLTLAFCFVGALVRKQKENNDLADANSELPLFIDAPFSVLDTRNRRGAYGILPEISDQLILTFLDTQWKDGSNLTAEQHFTPLVGKCYMLQVVNPNQSDDDEVTDGHNPLVWKNSEYEYEVSSKENFSYTKIVEITDGK